MVCCFFSDKHKTEEAAERAIGCPEAEDKVRTAYSNSLRQLKAKCCVIFFFFFLFPY